MDPLISAVFALTMDSFGPEAAREVTVLAPAPDPAVTNDEVVALMTVDNDEVVVQRIPSSGNEWRRHQRGVVATTFICVLYVVCIHA